MKTLLIEREETLREPMKVWQNHGRVTDVADTHYDWCLYRRRSGECGIQSTILFRSYDAPFEPASASFRSAAILAATANGTTCLTWI